MKKGFLKDFFYTRSSKYEGDRPIEPLIEDVILINDIRFIRDDNRNTRTYSMLCQGDVSVVGNVLISENVYLENGIIKTNIGFKKRLKNFLFNPFTYLFKGYVRY